jgi:hypothetical protein
MRLAFLNSCEGARGGATDIFSSTAAALVRRGTPAVVAMQYEVTDGAAIQFSRSFYTAVADGLPVDASVSAARMGVWLADSSSLEWGTPVLYMRARDGALFRIESDAPPRATPNADVASPAPTAGAAAVAESRAAERAALAPPPAPPGAELLGRGVGAAWRWGQQAAAAARQAARSPADPGASESKTVAAGAAEAKVTAPQAVPSRPGPQRLRFCTNCGARRPDGMRFCTTCGHDLG